MKSDSENSCVMYRLKSIVPCRNLIDGKNIYIYRTTRTTVEYYSTSLSYYSFKYVYIYNMISNMIRGNMIEK